MTNDNPKETEIKLLVDDFAIIEARLVALGAKLHTARVFERNVRYENAEHSLTEQGVVVRLRQDNRVRLTFKDRGSVTDGVIERFEAEVTVDNFATMDVILNKLGYQAYMTYEKYRTTYLWHETEIVLDELPYGKFVEVEGSYVDIFRAIKDLELTDAPIIPFSYTRLFDRLIEKLGLSFTDLTFANFEHISVDNAVILSLLS